MRKDRLPVRWMRWQRLEYGRRTAAGLKSHVAWQLTAAEVKLRYRVSRIIGNQAAEALELDYVEGEDGTRFVLRGCLNDLTAEQLASLRKLAA